MLVVPYKELTEFIGISGINLKTKSTALEPDSLLSIKLCALSYFSSSFSVLPAPFLLPLINFIVYKIARPEKFIASAKYHLNKRELTTQIQETGNQGTNAFKAKFTSNITTETKVEPYVCRYNSYLARVSMYLPYQERNSG